MDAASFDDVVRQLSSPIRAFLRTRVPADAVDDVLQETFSSLWSADQAPPETERDMLRLRQFTYRLAERRATDLWRSHTRHERRLKLAQATSERSPVPSPLDELIDKTPPDWLFDLPPEALEVLVRFANGSSVGDIAAELGISPNAVSSRLKRIRSKVPALIRECEEVD